MTSPPESGCSAIGVFFPLVWNQVALWQNSRATGNFFLSFCFSPESVPNNLVISSSLQVFFCLKLQAQDPYSSILGIKHLPFCVYSKTLLANSFCVFPLPHAHLPPFFTHLKFPSPLFPKELLWSNGVCEAWFSSRDNWEPIISWS